MEDHDLSMAFFEDPDGNTLALMQEAPKGCIFPKARETPAGPIASSSGV